MQPAPFLCMLHTYEYFLMLPIRYMLAYSLMLVSDHQFMPIYGFKFHKNILPIKDAQRKTGTFVSDERRRSKCLRLTQLGCHFILILRFQEDNAANMNAYFTKLRWIAITYRPWSCHGLYDNIFFFLLGWSLITWMQSSFYSVRYNGIQETVIQR